MMSSHPQTGSSPVAGSWDLVVVGHGAAGLSAALSYLQSVPAGSQPRVAVLDRADQEHRGGSTAWTTSSFRLNEDAQLDPGWGEMVRRNAAHRAPEHNGYVEAFYENVT